MAWDPGTYLKFGSQRIRPAVELLSRVEAESPRVVVDLGCGPGNSTALLAARWPQARVEGVDSSPAMLEEARRSKLAAAWTEADIATWAPASPPDVIFSNAAFHWVPDHARLLPRLLSCLAPQGTLAFQVPRNFDEPSHRIIRDVAEGGPWAKTLTGLGDWSNVLAPQDYFAVLEPHAAHIDAWETIYLQALEGDDAVFRWVSGTALLPFAEALEDPARAAFLEECRRRMAQAYPRRASGKTLFSFRRLFVVARP
jgi:trans-aconitate 2-methyltransferase